MEDTVSDEEGTPVDTSHRNYDEKVLIFLPGGTPGSFMFLCRRRGQMEATPEGAHFLSTVRHVPGCKRRMQSRLGISRVPFIEVRVLF